MWLMLSSSLELTGYIRLQDGAVPHGTALYPPCQLSHSGSLHVIMEFFTEPKLKAQSVRAHIGKIWCPASCNAVVSQPFPVFPVKSARPAKAQTLHSLPPIRHEAMYHFGNTVCRR